MEMPSIGLGVYGMGSKTAETVALAIKLGYRLIDCAAIYNNERAVGEGIRASGIDRRELFVTTKLHIDDYGFDVARAAFDLSCRKLGVNYVDLYLLHWPMWKTFDRTVDAWRAMQRLRADGRAKTIGVSNFTIEHLQALNKEADGFPAVNQVELNPMLNEVDLRAFAKANRIALQAWSPLGGTQGRPLAHPTITDLAAKHGRTPAQIVLRWHLEHGVCPVPKSVTPSRLAENLDVFGFALSADEIAAIDKMETGERSTPHPDLVDEGTWGAKVL